jgi:glycosyltransferase involved in cell wall biosynthesis
MRILFLAPQAYFQVRGTPIAIDLLLGTLSERGDRVDLLTLHVGEDREHDHVTIHRIHPPFAPTSVPAGFSLCKLYCDLFILLDAARMLRRKSYDLIYAVEEAAFIAMALGKFTGTPYAVDVDSSMTDQLVANRRWLRPARGLLAWLEALPMRDAVAVVPMCDALAQHARRHTRGIIRVLRDVSLLSDDGSVPVENLRHACGIAGPLVMYAGNLKAYQGIDLLLEAFAALRKVRADAVLVIIGGSPPDVATYRNRADALGLGGAVHFLGERPVEALSGFLKQADLLVSPRIGGTNTPMKVYSYLDSGVPVVATDLPTHTQVMSPRHAALAAPNAADMALAMARVLGDPEEQARLAGSARALVRQLHSFASFRDSARQTLADIERRLLSLRGARAAALADR